MTPEYQAIYQKIMAAHASGVKDPTTCLPPGMPRTMVMYEPMEIIVMPDTTYLMITYMSEFRRIYTDGRKWPEDIEPSYAGYSIGHWVDENKDGHYNVLEVETRAMKGPAHVRCERPAAAQGQRDRGEGADLSGQERSQSPA